MAAICSVEGCLAPAWSRGWCKRHYYVLRPMPPCAVEGCPSDAYKRGWCNAHYQKWRSYGDPLADRRRQRTWCSVEGCERGVHGDGLCPMHYERRRRTGTTDPKKRVAQSNDRRCPRCGKTKHKSQFSSNPSNPSGVGTYCKPCASAKERERRTGLGEAERRRRRGHELKKRGITLDQFDALLVSQGGFCAICHGAANGTGGTYHVDHDHACCPGFRSCGQCVRGVLCHSCNCALGHLNDDLVRLRAAIAYLEDPPMNRLRQQQKETT